MGLRVEGQRGVKVELQEPEQAGAALRLADQRAELLVRGALRELGEQRPDVRLADTGVDAVQDYLKQPFAGQYVATHRYVEHSPGPVDVPVSSTGTWSLEGDRLLLGADGDAPGHAWEVAAAQEDRLTLKR